MKTTLKLLTSEEVKIIFEEYYIERLNKKYDTIEDSVSYLTKDELENIIAHILNIYKEQNNNQYIPNRTIEKLINKIQLTIKYYKKNKNDKWWKSARRY